ncbi:MAG TPA: tRNA (adenosine(37)-N6)-dimethylallyltransferase MiaA [bacterium]|nr:tRNA (adenosine(37)-N6)-dimethylallyltransferase MiaA [bacterium]
MMKKPLIVIVGPTAVGKSEVAIELAKRMKGEIISCDSRQVFKYLNIGTAKPTKEERKKVPHHLIDIIEPDEEFNAFLYAQRVYKAISGIHRKRKTPILVGGSGLYLRAVIDGIFPGAGRNEKIRERLEKFSSGCLYKKLKETDPKTALRLHPHDKVRILRALEVYELTGQPISVLQKVSKGRKPDYEGALPLAPSTKKARITRFSSNSERLSYYEGALPLAPSTKKARITRFSSNSERLSYYEGALPLAASTKKARITRFSSNSERLSYYEGALPLASSTKKARITRFSSNSERLSYYDLTMIGLKREREELYRRINRRGEEMIKEGLVKEVKNLLKKGFAQDLIALKGLGYKEIIGYLNGEYDLKEAIRLLKRNSRRFAKRQLTWFNKDKRIHWIEIAEKESANRVASQIANMVEC